MNRKLIRKVAKAHGVSVKEVRESINTAIDHAYTNPTPQALRVNRKGEKPTPDEIVGYAVQKIKAKHD
jgi:hypothetical protein